MRAAGLIAIATLLTSEAVLIRSATPNPANAELIERVTSRVAGVIAAGKYVLCNYNVPRALVKEATKITPGRRAASVSPLEDNEWVSVSSMVLKAEVADVMDRLQLIGMLSTPPRRTDVLPRRDRHPQRWTLKLSSLGNSSVQN